MNRYFVHKSAADSLISEETFEIMIETVSRCEWCIVPDSRFLYSISAPTVERKRVYMYKKGHFGGF